MNTHTRIQIFRSRIPQLIQKWAKIDHGCIPVLKFESHLFEKMNLERTAGKAVIHFYIYFRSLRTIDHTAGFTLTQWKVIGQFALMLVSHNNVICWWTWIISAKQITDQNHTNCPETDGFFGQCGLVYHRNSESDF